MENYPDGIQRRVSLRKRSSDNLNRMTKKVKYSTPSKAKRVAVMADPIPSSVINSDKCLSGSPKSAASKSDQSGWIKNSFITHPPGSDTWPSCHQVTSTPKAASKHDQAKSDVLPTTPNTYLSEHHKSFSEDDSLFADFDLVAIEQGKYSIRKPSTRGGTSAKKQSSRKSRHLLSSPADHSVVNLRPKVLIPSATKKHLRYSEQAADTVITTFDVCTFDSDDSLFSEDILSGIVEKCEKGILSTRVEGQPSQDFKGTRAKQKTKKSSEGEQEMTTQAQMTSPDPGAMETSQTKRRSMQFRTLSGSQLIIEDCEDNPNDHVTDGQILHKDSDGLPPQLHRQSPIPAQVSADLVTPVSNRSGSIRNRIKKALSDNIRSVTPVASRTAKLKAENFEKALKAAEELRGKGTEYDIGPFYGLPSKVADLLKAQRGITKLYDWQDECLSLDAVRQSRNLIYSLPTSGGKTLVAEVLILRELLCKKRDALLVLPFVAIVQEKVKSLSPFALELGFTVEEYAASKGQLPPRRRQRRKAIYIATLEKANSLVNSLVEAGRMKEIGLVVVDELHMLGEGGSRGAILEMTITKLMHVAGGIQIIGMSATLGNIEDLSRFLHADVYSNDFRPVELREYVKMDDVLYEINSRALCPEDQLKHSRVCTFKYDSIKNGADPDHLAGLVQEVVPQHSCLVFCPTKKNCENVTTLLCKLLPKQLLEVKHEARRGLLKMLWHEGDGEVCPILRRTVPYGIAYHHSGLTMDERRLIEEAYLNGTLCLLACTSTLAAGVNLPAKRVILRSPNIGMAFLSRSQYKQMVGRAGRAGLDSSGESILILQKKDKLKLKDLVGGPCDFCHSSLLYENHKGVRRLLLTSIGLKITETLSSVTTFLQRTLYYIQIKDMETDIIDVAQKALQQLLDLGLITQTVEARSPEGQEVNLEDYRLTVTKLGRAVFKGSIDIDRGPQLYSDLRQGQESLVVANHLHLLYLVTPYDMVTSVKPDWMMYLQQMNSLESHEMKVATLIGVPESYIAKRASGQRVRKTVDEFVVTRFYVTLILYNLWKQHSIWDVSSRFQLPRGLIQSILNGASTFAACIAHFCQELEEFWAYQDLFASFVKNLSYCFMMDLIPLMEIPGVKTGRARQLYNAGFRNLQQVAHSDPRTLSHTINHLSVKMASNMITAAKVLLNDKVEALQEEAEQMITMPTEMPIATSTVAMTTKTPSHITSQVSSQAKTNSAT